jgi:hypothetical protein
MSRNHNISPRVISKQENPLRLWTNPVASELDELPEIVRFTAVLSVRKNYLWDYFAACHTDISVYLQLQDRYDSAYFLKGAAIRQTEGRFTMFQSHFLESFKRSRLTRQERAIVGNLLGQDWSWVNEYVEVNVWLKAFGKRIGL